MRQWSAAHEFLAACVAGVDLAGIKPPPTPQCSTIRAAASIVAFRYNRAGFLRYVLRLQDGRMDVVCVKAFVNDLGRGHKLRDRLIPY